MTKIKDGENAEDTISSIAAAQLGRQALEPTFPALPHTLAWPHYGRYPVIRGGEPQHPKVSALAALLHPGAPRLQDSPGEMTY